jgi:aryl-alcohol dehydrogenase-like predicted oxidoreductase
MELVTAGKVRHLGLSNETPYGVMKFAQAAEKLGGSRMISIQNSYSLLVRSDFENGLTEVCSGRNENVGLLAYSPLAGGILTGTRMLYVICYMVYVIWYMSDCDCIYVVYV